VVLQKAVDQKYAKRSNTPKAQKISKDDWRLRRNPEIGQNVRGINESQLESTSSLPHGQVFT